jgi:hypothetical protein
MASADFRSALTKQLSPGKALILSLHTVRLYFARLGWISGFTLASTLAARAQPRCRFVFLWSKICSPLPSACPRQQRHRVGPCGSLRLPPSVPTGSLHPARISPCWAHWRTPTGVQCRHSWRHGPAILLLFFSGFVLATTPLSAHEIITTKLTWTEHISRIFQRRCVGCHHRRGKGQRPRPQGREPHAR